MPIVFVHGVNNRAGDEYRDNEAGRNGFLKAIVAPALGLKGKDVTIVSPYWGGDGAKFAWDMSVLPDPADSYEAFGSENDDPLATERVLELLAKSPNATGDPVELAKADFEGTVELIYASALAASSDQDQAQELAASYERAMAYATAHPKPDWLATAEESNFADLLNHHVHAGDEESFAAGGVFDQLKEGFSRLVNALPAAGTEVLGALGRRKLNATVTRFAGDAFVYLSRRGAPGSEGTIVKLVLAGLDEAIAKKTAQDNKLIVIAHSFGGEVMYDILTTFRPTLQVDCLITVGSQVGLFEEMKVYLASKDDIPKHYPDGRVPKPAGAKRWLNVFDMNDVLSYRASPVFDGVDDFEYETGYSTLQAHGGYFLRPSFYTRLAKRLKS